MITETKNIDILCVGEVLVDFIGHQPDVHINETRDYHRYLGGSPANVAMNAARLGLNSAMVACVGNDGFSEYVFERFAEIGVDSSNVKKSDLATSVIFVSRSIGTPDFIPYRDADYHITEDQISSELLANTTVFHTTCFALSKKPAQETILKKAQEAFKLGCQLSIDLNYASRLWNSKEEAMEVINAYCALNPLLKISEDDMLRFFGKEIPHEDIFAFFHKL